MTAQNIALHIGIDDYTRFAPNGAANLRGAVNDSNRWSRYARETLHADVTTLQDEAADHAAIVSALRTLGAAVAATPGASGLVTFSGHGCAMPDLGETGVPIGASAAVCPSDVRLAESGVAHLLSLEAVERALGAGAANTTIVIDACYTPVPVGGRPGRGLPLPDGHPTAGRQVPQNLHDVTSRLILATEPWSESYEVKAGGNWHGALSFSLLELLEQWSTLQTSEGAWFARAAYGDLVYKARQQLEVIGLAQQRPLLLGPPRAALIPFARPGSYLVAGMTSPVPDGPREGAQLSAGAGNVGYRIYQWSAVTAAGNLPLAYAVATKNSSGALTDSAGNTLAF